MKYEYLLHVWGGFFNESNIKFHGIKKFNYKWFNTKVERDMELQKLENAKLMTSAFNIANSKVDNSVLCVTLQEGYMTRYKQIIQAIVKDEGIIKEVENVLGYGFFSDEELKNVDVGTYMKEWKYGITSDLSDDHELLFSTLILKLE